MKNKGLCYSGAIDQQQEDKDGEESTDGSLSSDVAIVSSERCPICLSNLPLEVGFPGDCSHAFCISCILKWSEMSLSCPVDRKPFQTIYKIDAAGSCTKIPIVARPREDVSCSCSLCTWCSAKSKICFRLEVNEESTNKIMGFSTKNGCRDQEKLDYRQRDLDMGSLCLSDDITTEQQLDYLETSQLINWQ